MFRVMYTYINERLRLTLNPPHSYLTFIESLNRRRVIKDPMLRGWDPWVNIPNFIMKYLWVQTDLSVIIPIKICNRQIVLYTALLFIFFPSVLGKNLTRYETLRACYVWLWSLPVAFTCSFSVCNESNDNALLKEGPVSGPRLCTAICATGSANDFGLLQED